LTETHTPSTALDPADFLSFTAICKGLPHVKPRVNKDWIQNEYFNAITAESETVDLAGNPVTCAELTELFCNTDRGEVVSPAGARLLIRLYKANVFELNGKRLPGEVSSELVCYSESEATLREKSLQRQAERLAYNDRLTCLATFNEGEFTYRLLDDIFWADQGKGKGSLVIGGVLVQMRISAIVDAGIKLIVDGVSAPSWTRRDARKRGRNVSQAPANTSASGGREALGFDF